MNVSSVFSRAPTPMAPLAAAPKPPDAKADDEKLRSTFQDFVGQTLFGETLKSMRKTQHKPAYFHGGRAEEIFQQQLDQVLAEKLSRASADQLAGPMFELFTLNRK